MIKYIYTFLLLAFLSPAIGQTMMTLEQCRKQALDYNKDLVEASLIIEEAQASMALAKKAYLPMFDASVMAVIMPNSDISIDIPGSFLPTAESLTQAQAGDFSGVSDVYSPGMELSVDNLLLGTGSVTVTQPIYVGGKIRAINKQAKLGYKIAEENLQLTKVDVIQKTDEAYWNLVTAKDAVALASSYVIMLNELEDQMEAMYEAQLLPKSEKLKVSVQKNQAELEQVRAENGQKLAMNYLNQIIGMDLTTDLIPQDQLNEQIKKIDMSNGIEQALTYRSELKILENKASIAREDETIVRSGYRPEVGVSASYNYTYADDLSSSGKSLVDRGGSNIIGSATIPVFHWGEKKQKGLKAKIATQKAENELSKVIDLITLETMQTQLQAEEYYQAVLLANKSVVQAKESLDETEASFKVGLNTTADVLVSQAEYQKARYNLLTSLMAYETIKTQWLKATGQLLRTQL